jgi:hypothetical protein
MRGSARGAHEPARATDEFDLRWEITSVGEPMLGPT